ncbi:hypothetical protein JFU18_27945 [Bacillus sp. TH22]|uniref:hypothetical protein n=1 Tax=Bacillus TaxID=1386 RepID=UPI00191396F7|nr:MULTISPECIES: hypothetical protein [unclassified Bacillus (in: firmicutes)]MBK5345617.1 hypothetical protein [Bacillus sp. TH45]MBK5367339.1 hypothetical protein [Bacillus sp. TH50]MBK5452298.1 hypothetical protein [Bacillus sp. TH22]MBK5457787.1 hypothetical protein [Bacillus sp. TH23]
MNSFFLSILNVENPLYANKADYLQDFNKKQTNVDSALDWLFEDNIHNIPSIHDSKKQEEFLSKTIKVPTFNAPHSDILLKLISESNIPADEIDVLCYCHETLEQSHSMLPVLKAKKELKLKKALPFSIGQAGSLSSIMAMDIAKALLNNGYKNFLATIVDSMHAPFSRSAFNGYTKGDVAISLLLNNQNGDYKIKYFKVYPTCHNISPAHWSINDYLTAEDLLVAKYRELLDDINNKEHSIKWTVYQNVSNRLDNMFKEIGFNKGLNSWNRIKSQEINLLSSDVFLSLLDLESNKKLKPGDDILLVSASIDHGIAGVVLEKM